MQVRMYNRVIAEVPAGTVIAKIYMGGVWHNYRCFVPKDTDGYFPEVDAERYKGELRSLGVSFPIEFECLHEPPREEAPDEEEYE